MAELCASLIYEGIIQQKEPLDLLDDEHHAAWWFEGGSTSMATELAALSEDREYVNDALPPPPKIQNASPLLAARAQRAQPKRRTLPADLTTPPPVPKGAVPDGPAHAAPDLRSKASRALVRAKLAALQQRRPSLEEAIDAMLDPLAAPKLPAMDVSVLLLFLSELESDASLPVPVACNEAVALSKAYSGDEQHSYRHVNGLLASYAREVLGRHVPEREGA